MLFTRKSSQETRAIRIGLVGNGLLVVVSVLALSGCVSAAGDMRSEDNVVPIEAEAPPAPEQQDDGKSVAGYRDPMVSARGNPTGSGSAEPAGAPAQPGNLADVIMQPAQVNAHQTSIYASGTAALTDAGSRPDAVPAISNLYSVSPAAIPVDGNAETTGSIPAKGRRTDEEASLIPDRVPLPKSGRTALAADPAASEAAIALAATAAGTGQTPPPEETDGTADANGGGAGTPNDLNETLTFAGLFAAKRKTNRQSESNSSTAAPRPRVLNRSSAAAYQSASLGGAMPGAATDSLFAPPDHSEAEEEMPEGAGNGVTEVASLAGLARLSPNGLWLQTEKVNTGCFKPELLSVLKSIEKHYGKPVIVTSGVRPTKQNRSRQSLHTRCEAADIQIAGVSRWELADYLRSMPGRGGVGTYCHTESVHIDIGPERDWNWQCRGKQ